MRTYTEAEMQALLQAEREKFAGKNKPVVFKHNAGEFTTKKGDVKSFSNIRIEGNFYPTSLSYSAAEGILANLEAFKGIVASRPKVEAKTPLTTAADTAPRIAAK